jgi:1-deoxy-D-xylulose-5-phosphate synthase
LALDGSGPQFLHIVTKKGQGYKLAEADPILYHGPGKFDPSQGIVAAATNAKTTFTQIFGQWLCDQAKVDERLIAITPAMREGSGLVEFEKQYPGRYYDVGIAEQHAVTFAAGLACEGLKPVVAIYSTFLQRGYDQLIHDVALQDLPVVFALDRAGIVGADGATHAGAFDIPYLRCIPNMVIMTPSNERECRQLLSTAFNIEHPTAVRYPRGAGAGIQALENLDTLPLGQAKIEKVCQQESGTKIVVLCFGTLLYAALDMAHKLDVSVVNMRFVKPLDEKLLLQLASEYDGFVSLEDGVVAGGAGSACIEFLMKSGVCKPFLQLGLPDQFIDHGDPQVLMSQCGLDALGIEKSINSYFSWMN